MDPDLRTRNKKWNYEFLDSDRFQQNPLEFAFPLDRNIKGDYTCDVE
jgi:hypothetical protein